MSRHQQELQEHLEACRNDTELTTLIQQINTIEKDRTLRLEEKNELVSLTCPITIELPSNPVTLNGRIYDRSSLINHQGDLILNNDPLTRQPININMITPYPLEDFKKRLKSFLDIPPNRYFTLPRETHFRLRKASETLTPGDQKKNEKTLDSGGVIATSSSISESCWMLTFYNEKREMEMFQVEDKKLIDLLNKTQNDKIPMIPATLERPNKQNQATAEKEKKREPEKEKTREPEKVKTREPEKEKAREPEKVKTQEIPKSTTPTLSTNTNALYSHQPEYDHLFKLKLVGDSGVGKSCLLLRFVDGTYTDSYISSIGVDFKTTTRELHKKIIKTQIWDTTIAGRFSCTSQCDARHHGYLLCFDLTDQLSFNNAKYWLQEIKKYSYQNPPTILIGCKSDLLRKRVVSEQEIEDFCTIHNLDYCETSSLTGENVEKAFEILTLNIARHFNPEFGKPKAEASSEKENTQNTPSEGNNCLMM